MAGVDGSPSGDCTVVGGQITVGMTQTPWAVDDAADDAAADANAAGWPPKAAGWPPTPRGAKGRQGGRQRRRAAAAKVAAAADDAAQTGKG